MTFRAWRDDPIVSIEDDTLDRSTYAEQLAAVIAETHSWEGSTVFGLTGSWGCGKSSLIGLVDENLTKMASDYAIVRFTPWAACDVNGVLADFYAALSTALPRNIRKKARRSLATLLLIGAPAGSLLPVGGSVAASALAATADVLSENKSWDQAFKEASDQIIKGRRKILVIVDDIDRLQGDELLMVLKVIRLLGRFPGVQYLLAYDHDSLTHTLVTSGAARTQAEAGRYTEKVVQYALPVPALVGVQVIERLNNGLGEILKARRPQLSEKQLHQTRDLIPVMLRVLATPRAIDRYLAQVDYQLRLHVPGEVDDEDILALVLLRVAFPSVFARLPHYETELVSGHVRESPVMTWTDREPQQFTVDDLLDGLTLTSEEQRSATLLLRAMFPNLRQQRQAARPKSIGSSDYFSRYLSMNILEKHDVADGDISTALRGALEGQGQALASLLRDDNVALAALAFQKIQDLYLSEFENVPVANRAKALLALLACLISVLEELDNSESVLFTLYSQVPWWIGRKVFPTLPESVDSDALANIVQTANLPTRLAILASAIQGLQSRPGWLRTVHSTVFPEAQSAFLDHLRQRDNAHEEPNDLVQFFVNSNLAGVALEPLRSAIADTIANGGFTIADLAARFVTMVDPGSTFAVNPHFKIIAPRIDYPWYAETGGLPAGGRWNWSDRRSAAAHMISDPPRDD